jgi:hypothetical protein
MHMALLLLSAQLLLHRPRANTLLQGMQTRVDFSTLPAALS